MVSTPMVIGMLRAIIERAGAAEKAPRAVQEVMARAIGEATKKQKLAVSEVVGAGDSIHYHPFDCGERPRRRPGARIDGTTG